MATTIIDARAFLVDVAVETERTDAVQSFVKQETIFVELDTSDGLAWPRLLLHDRDRGSRGAVDAARPPARPADRPGRRSHRGDLAPPVRLDSRHHDRRDHLARARRDRHRAVGCRVPARRAAAVAARRRVPPRRAAVRHRGRLAAPARSTNSCEGALASQRSGSQRGEGQDRQADGPRGPRTPDRGPGCRRPRASTSWSTRTSR